MKGNHIRQRQQPPDTLFTFTRFGLIFLVWLGWGLGFNLAAQQGLASYYEAPRALGSDNMRYEQAYTVNDHVILLYQKIRFTSDEGGEIDIAGRISLADGRLGDEFSVATGLPFVGTTAPPLLYSAAVDGLGHVFLAYSNSAQAVTLLSADGPTSARDFSHRTLVFRERGGFQANTTVVTPRLYLKPGGGFVVLVTKSSAQSQNSLITRSLDGSAWSPMQAIDSELKDNINSNPAWIRVGSREFLVFQSLNFRDQVSGTKANYQLYLRYSDDEGLAWSPLKLLTSFKNAGDGPDTTATDYDNQRPLLAPAGASLQLFWERKLKTDPPQIWNLQLGEGGNALQEPQAVTDSDAGAFNPVWQRQGSTEYLSWFSSAIRSSDGWLSVRTGKTWTHRNMSHGYAGLALYPAFAFAKDKLHYFYYARSEADPLVTRLIWIEPDQHADPPTLIGVNFDDGKRDKHIDLRTRLLPAADAAGFAGYNLVLSQSPDAPVAAKAVFTDPDNPPPFQLTGDGTWYVLARVVDKAGNWSPVASIRYVLDTTPPDPVKFAPLPVDEKGYLRANTFSVDWKAPPQDDVANYSWSLQYLGDISITEAFAKSVALESLPVMGTQATTSISRTNVENGIYLLAVWANDKVGNRSKVRFVYLFANKYIPSTVITFIDIRQDVMGERFLDISGRGFNRNGTITRIVLSKTGLAPFDYEYRLDRGDYSVASDRLIQGLKLANVHTASYLLGIEHSERGFEFSGRRLDFEERGTIKFGDFSLTPQGSFTPVKTGLVAVQAGDLLLWLLMLLLAIIAFVSVFQLRSVYRESLLLERVAISLVDGTTTPAGEELRKVKTMKQKRLGLRLKFAGFFLALTIAVVLLISLPLSDYTLQRQKVVLAQGLQDRLDVLMESLGSSASIYLPTPDQYSTELAQLPNQGSIMPEVSYITITAQGRNKSDNFDTVWASNDKRITGEQTAASTTEPAILKRSRTSFVIEGKQQTAYQAGFSGISDSLSPQIGRFRSEFDARLRTGLGSLPAELNALNSQLKGLLLNTTPAGQADALRIDNNLRDMRAQQTKRLRELAGNMLSQPGFSFGTYNPAVTDYVFYKPIYFPTAGDNPDSALYYRGMIRIGVSTVPINQVISSTQNEIIFRLIFLVLIALAGGVILAIVLSAIIVNPIRGLVDEVNKIKGIITLDVNSQVQKFEEHARNELVLRSNDELADLNETFNEMVHSLSKAADANVDLYAGKDIQRKFLPLDKRGDGNKGTTGALMTGHLDIFGYYEGAWGVSGDYFDYLRISKDVVAFIKCDISGKGVSAALIMVEVATLFQNYFDNWETKHPATAKPSGKPLIAPLVTSINDLIADREFVGKFAAMNIVLLNETTGECTFCNAGDEKVFIYRAATRKVELFYLTNQRAAGALSSKIFPFDYKEDRNRLNQGDMLLYFTDGIEESQSILRGPDLNLAPVTREDIKAGLFPAGTAGQLHEELGIERINAIIEAVMRRGSYELVKTKNPAPDRTFSFNFKDSQGTAEDAVLYLAAVERIYRLIPYGDLTDKDRIQIDKKVDDRLRTCFDQYPDYFHNRAHEKELAARKVEIDQELAKLSGTKTQKQYEPVQAAYDEEKLSYENDRRAFESEMKRSGGTLDDPEREAALEARREKLRILEDQLRVMKYKVALNSLQEVERELKEDENSLYRTFGNLREDPQFDDLTLLAIRKL